MSREERTLLLDRHKTEIGINKVVRITKRGEFIPAEEVLLKSINMR